MAHPDTIRGPIELTHNKIRDDREKQYVTDRLALETDFHGDLKDIQTAKETALVAAGLNPDGGVPPSFYEEDAPMAASKPKAKARRSKKAKTEETTEETTEEA